MVQMLGICSALAVTSKKARARYRHGTLWRRRRLSNVVISLLRKTIPNCIRIIVQLVVAATLVTIASEASRLMLTASASSPSVFVGLIIMNCILMGRLEAFALGNGPWESLPRRYRERSWLWCCPRRCWLLP